MQTYSYISWIKSRQLHCRDVCKISLWSVECILNHSTANFGRISNSIEMSVSGTGAWIGQMTSFKMAALADDISRNLVTRVLWEAGRIPWKSKICPLRRDRIVSVSRCRNHNWLSCPVVFFSPIESFALALFLAALTLTTRPLRWLFRKKYSPLGILGIWKRQQHDDVIARGVEVGHLGWGLLNQFPPLRYFPNFSSLSKHTLTVKYRIYIWQVSPQLSCGDTCQIWMWFDESNMYFCVTENFAYGKINERSFSNPHPSNASLWGFCWCQPVKKLLNKKSSCDWFDQQLGHQLSILVPKLNFYSLIEKKKYTRTLLFIFMI